MSGQRSARGGEWGPVRGSTPRTACATALPPVLPAASELSQYLYRQRRFAGETMASQGPTARPAVASTQGTAAQGLHSQSPRRSGGPKMGRCWGPQGAVGSIRPSASWKELRWSLVISRIVCPVMFIG